MQPTGVQGIEAVDVLCRVDRGDDFVRVDLRRQGKLHQNAMDAGIGVEARDQPQ
jgi:hypothetical protein